MRGTVLGLVLLSFVTVIAEVKSEGSLIRLCGRDFVRAIVFTCGGSRWRRQLNDFPKGFADEDYYPYLSLNINDSTGANGKYKQKEKSQSKEFIPSISEAERDLQGQKQKLISKRQEELLRLINKCTINYKASTVCACQVYKNPLRFNMLHFLKESELKTAEMYSFALRVSGQIRDTCRNIQKYGFQEMVKRNTPGGAPKQ